MDAAARRYFGKSARLLTIPEAATIAGLLKAPSRYSPARNPDLAEDRAQLVLAAMNEEGYITGDEAKNALAAPAKVVRRYTTASENYAADWVMDVLPHFIGSIETDIVVDTTIDPKMQRAAEQALRNALKETARNTASPRAAVVTLDTAGAVKALVGGADYSKSQFNRAAYAKRSRARPSSRSSIWPRLKTAFRPRPSARTSRSGSATGHPRTIPRTTTAR